MQSQRPVLKQVQKLKMTPQLYQAVRLMALPLQDLKTTIEEELEKNPALQVEEDRSTSPWIPCPSGDKGVGEGDWFDHSSDTGYSRAGGPGGKRRQAAVHRGGAFPSRRACRTTSWRSSPCSRSPRTGCRSGSFSSAISTRTASTRNRRRAAAEGGGQGGLPRVMALIQGFDPVGTCVKDVRESLLVQIRTAPATPPPGRGGRGRLPRGPGEAAPARDREGDEDLGGRAEGDRRLPAHPGPPPGATSRARSPATSCPTCRSTSATGSSSSS